VEDLLSLVEEKAAGDVVELRLLRGCDAARAEIVRVKLISRDDLPETAPDNSFKGVGRVGSGRR